MKNNQDDKGKPGEWQPDTLMELLIAQCADLEGLLALARRETAAANSKDFSELFVVYGERAKVGDRLESYHRQVSELRGKLAQGVGPYVDPVMSSRAVRLVIEIQAQDAKTKCLLMSTQMRTREDIARLNSTQRNALAYLRGARGSGLSCDRRG